MKRTATASSTLALPFGLCLLALGACGGSSSAVGEAGIGGFGRGDFQVVRTAPVNGATIFLNAKGEHIASVSPQKGTALIFDHHLFHRGQLLTSGTKYLVRSDLLYAPFDPASGERLGFFAD